MLHVHSETVSPKVRSPPAEDGVPSVGAPPLLDGTSPTIQGEADKENQCTTREATPSLPGKQFEQEHAKPVTPFNRSHENSRAHLNKLGQLSQTFGYLNSRRSTVRKGPVRSMTAELRSRERKDPKPQDHTPSKRFIPHVKPLEVNNVDERWQQTGSHGREQMNGRCLQQSQDLPLAMPNEIEAQLSHTLGSKQYNQHNVHQSFAGSFTPHGRFNTRKLHDSRSTEPRRVFNSCRIPINKGETFQFKDHVASRIVAAASTPDSFLNRSLKRYRDRANTSRELAETKRSSRVKNASRVQTQTRKSAMRLQKDVGKGESSKQPESVSVRLDFEASHANDENDGNNYSKQISPTDVSSIRNLESVYQDSSDAEEFAESVEYDDQPLKSVISQLSSVSMMSSPSTNNVMNNSRTSHCSRDNKDPVARKLEISTDSEASSRQVIQALSFLSKPDTHQRYSGVHAPVAQKSNSACQQACAGNFFTEWDRSHEEATDNSPTTTDSNSDDLSRQQTKRAKTPSSGRKRKQRKATKRNIDGKTKESKRPTRKQPPRTARTKALQNLSSKR